MKSTSPVVRAIDVGFGNTKFTTASFDEGAGCDLFTSLAPMTPPSMLKSDDLLDGGRTINVKVDGNVYTVGKDAHTAAATSTVRVMEAKYPLTQVYHALVKGALYEMAVEHIDILVLGLPMNTYAEYRTELAKRMTGKHTIPNPAKKLNPFNPSEVTVTIDRVFVIPQPIGAFLNYSVPRGLVEALESQLNLVIDVGRGTLDWFVSKGSQPIKSRSGACFGGVAKIALAVADHENVNLKQNQSMMERVESALHSQKPIMINRQEVNIFTKHKTVIESSIAEPIQTMMAGIGNTLDIDNILVTGGGAGLYMDQLVKAFGEGALIIDEDPIFSNVKGFQLAGEQYVAQSANAKSAA